MVRRGGLDCARRVSRVENSGGLGLALVVEAIFAAGKGVTGNEQGDDDEQEQHQPAEIGEGFGEGG